MTKYFLFLLLTLSLKLFSQDSLTTFRLTTGKKVKTIFKLDDIRLDKDKIAINTDTIRRRIYGKFLFIYHDTIALKPTYINDFMLFNHNNINDFGDSNKYFAANTDAILKINIKEINRIVYYRKHFPKIMRYSFYASVITALIISPLVSIEKGGFNKDKFKTISGISGGTAFFTLIFGLASIEKEHELIPTKRKRRIWTIQK